jgi:hypothetical protein
MLEHVAGPRLSAAVDQPEVDWADLIVGDSRIVMDTLLECDLMAGKVQMIYLDPSGEAHASAVYLRDRLARCRELLHESGSMFVRAGGDDLPTVRRLMDDVFGADHGFGIVTLESASDQRGEPLVWYCRDVSHVDDRQLSVLRRLHRQYPTVLGGGSGRRRTCGMLLR